MRTGRLEWRWARGPAGASAGVTTLRPDGTTRTIVAVNIKPTDLKRTIVHELGHIIDFHVHGGAEFSKDELEARADAFERRMLAPAPPRPKELPEPEPSEWRATPQRRFYS
jgi:hypothetical protein